MNLKQNTSIIHSLQFLVAGLAIAPIVLPMIAKAHGGENHGAGGGSAVLKESDAELINRAFIDPPPIELFPSSLIAAGIDQRATHEGADWVSINESQEAALYAKVKREQIGYDTEDGGIANARVAIDPGASGQWEGPTDWPVVAVHVTLLPNGRVLAYDSVGNAATETYEQHQFTRATVWNPTNNSHTRVNSNTGFNLFCSGLTLLPDGRVFFAGGNLNNALDGIHKTHTFNPSNNSWQIEGRMKKARWYPTTTALPNQEVLITGGLYDREFPDIPEVRGTNGALRSLTGASSSIAANRNYQWLRVAPDGRVANVGPDSNMYFLNTNGQGAWASFAPRGDGTYRSYGSFAMFAPGRILISGGARRNKTAVIVDLNNRSVQSTSNMAFERRQHNLTILADGQVLATGGYQNSDESLVDLRQGRPVFPAEVWNPATGQWKTLARMKVTRQYHSSALLLPDGRVLSAGGGICGDCTTQNYLAKNAEIFSPPYLFKKDGSGQRAARPSIGTAPGNLGYGANFTVTSAQAGTISKIGLVRMGGVTHSVNMDQLYVPLSFTRRGNNLTVKSPGNNRIAPPGYYMMFLMNRDGVPSIAKILRVG
jgi:hypothetical protein